MNNQHLKDYMAATEGAVEKFTLNEMTKEESVVSNKLSRLTYNQFPIRHNHLSSCS
jgi:hypothetical protein